MEVQPNILGAFTKLGSFLREFCEDSVSQNHHWSKALEKAIIKAGQQNGWFTKNNVLEALNSWGTLLTKINLEAWLSPYHISKDFNNKTIAIIMAGNIPLVGFHDFLAVLITGNRVIGKLSSNDAVLLPFLVTYLLDTEPLLKKKIHLTQEKLERFDAVIATGSNNTSRYFDYYFGKYPNIIRRNRNSIAVLTGNESIEELKLLGNDVFQYFGLGCRSVSKIFIPKNFELKHFFEAIFEFQDVANNHKYANNYDYNKAVFLMSEFKILDNNFLLLKEDKSYASPIGTLYYEYYDTMDSLNMRLKSEASELQCIVGNSAVSNSIPFGTTQTPDLTDYADGVDTIQFLLNL
ncbi:acyl-CoA reductase [Croceitalea sp. P059]|uniref:acyl-CoA reductase n=1 Tax=Croceitalea sp. P059 TaxID=3075601 RepID=UPI002885629A|nr:acyl-CoA reductase [Croceitalea sp. P059]MDT0539613.1 acyl-CoA reductase [Croceitalea sp. P059]